MKLILYQFIFNIDPDYFPFRAVWPICGHLFISILLRVAVDLEPVLGTVDTRQTHPEWDTSPSRHTMHYWHLKEI